jgi:hypothetical protein
MNPFHLEPQTHPVEQFYVFLFLSRQDSDFAHFVL